GIIMTTAIKILSLLILLNITYVHSMDPTTLYSGHPAVSVEALCEDRKLVEGRRTGQDSRLLLELPDEILGTVIKFATKTSPLKDDILETTKVLIRTSWLCEKLKHLSEP